MDILHEHALFQVLNAFLEALPDEKFVRKRAGGVWSPELTAASDQIPEGRGIDNSERRISSSQIDFRCQYSMVSQRNRLVQPSTGGDQAFDGHAKVAVACRGAGGRVINPQKHQVPTITSNTPLSLSPPKV